MTNHFTRCRATVPPRAGMDSFYDAALSREEMKVHALQQQLGAAKFWCRGLKTTLMGLLLDYANG